MKNFVERYYHAKNEDLLVETGILCLKIQETFEAVAL